MITIYFKDLGRVTRNAAPSSLESLQSDEILWIDLLRPTETEKKEVEKFISMHLPTKAQAEEIESTSKYSETADAVISNTNYFLSKGKGYHEDYASFIIKDGLLVSSHTLDFDSFADAEKRMQLHPSYNDSGYTIFLTILEAKIDHDADMEELLARQISRLSKEISDSTRIDKEVIRRINELQEKSITLRENIFDLQRVLSGIMRSEKFPNNISYRLDLMNKDIESLREHGDISFSRLDYMQDTAMGLINIEQNEIVKILSVAAVIFMPPTLIASIYGMNFKIMPEIDWVFTTEGGWVIPAGYIFAIGLMLLVTFLTYWFFRFKKWL